MERYYRNWAGWVSCNDGLYLQFESFARMWNFGGIESFTKEDGNNFWKGRGGSENRSRVIPLDWDRGQPVHTSTFLGILHLLAFKNTNRTKQLLTLARCSLRPCYSTSNLSAPTKFPLLSFHSFVARNLFLKIARFSNFSRNGSLKRNSFTRWRVK